MAARRDRIPKGKKVRLLFQPAEEGPGGALPMIKEGCLEGVDEVYGYHNVPNFEEGDVRVCPGPIMAQANIVRIKVHGKGGHGSVPHMINDVITAGSAILNALHTVKSRCIDSKENFVFTLTQFTSGFTYNVFPDEAFMQGSIRSYNAKTYELIMSKIKNIAENTALAMGCKADVEFIDLYPPTINHAKETEHVIRVASATFGAEKVKSQDLPLTASEDFSFFLENKPGCFYILGIKRPGENYCLHTSHYDYNDSMIASGGLLFVRIVEDRLGVKIL
jgi:hippurate hydrolase